VSEFLSTSWIFLGGTFTLLLIGFLTARSMQKYADKVRTSLDNLEAMYLFELRRLNNQGKILDGLYDEVIRELYCAQRALDENFP